MQFLICFLTDLMDCTNIRTCAKIFILFAFVFSKGLSEKYDKTTQCIYTKSGGIETFEFICEPNKYWVQYFINDHPINCYSDSGSSFYKERRHEIRFRDCYLKQLPIIFKWYTAVKYLNVSSVGLESLRSKNFNNAENLVSLIASHNLLTEIPSSLFDDAEKINYVDFSFNEINKIDPLAFDTENKIRSLNFSNNLIGQIENGTFGKLFELEVLDLSFNRMKDIQDGLFDNLRSLKVLNLKKNLLTQIKCSIFAFAQMLKLITLNLAENKLQVFDSHCVQSERFALFIESNRLVNLTLSENVTEINASDNKLTKIFSESDLENMIIFNISKNRIENVPEIIEQFGSQLRVLDVSDSPIGRLNISTFEEFDNMESLSLRNTDVSNFQYGTFHHQQNLRFLDLSNNNLGKINFGMLHWSSGQLETFYLDGNKLTDLSDLTKDNYPSLQYVSIDDNNFDCSYLSGVQYLWKKQGIFVALNPYMKTDVQLTDTHVNGITCYHDSIAVKEAIIASKIEVNDHESGNSELNLNETSSNATSALMWKVEILLICIVVVLVCLLVVAILKNFVPVFKGNCRSQETTELVYYRPQVLEQQSLI